MKKLNKLILILLSFMFVVSVNPIQAQKYNRGFSSTVDTLQAADTLIFAPTNVIDKYSGIASFSFTMTNITDSCNVVRMEGSNDFSNWGTVTSLSATNVTYGVLKDQNPDYLYYRLFTSTAAGDTVNITSVNFIYKEE